MKKIIIFLTLTLFIAQSFCQVPAKQGFSNDYLKKSKNQRTAAWVFFAAGTSMTVYGIFSFNSNWEKQGSYTETDVSGYIMLIGVAADIVSIPLFISSAVNKRKALSLSVTNQNSYLPHKNSLAINTQPALTLRFKF